MKKLKNKYIAVGVFTVLVILVVSILLMSKSQNNDNPPTTPEKYTSPGTEDYPNIEGLDELIKLKAPEEAILDLRRLFYDYYKTKDYYSIDKKSIKYSFEKLPSPDPNFTGIKKYTFTFKAKSKNEDKDYFYKIVQTDNTGFTFEIFSDKDFKKRLYLYDSSRELGD